jgi:hypothetical protein
MRQIGYDEGDWFAVPLPNGGFAVGVIARAMPSHGGVLLGYFFGPRRETTPTLEELSALSTSDAILVRKFGHLGLVHQRWPNLGRIGRWDRTAWPIPTFGRFEELTGRAFKVIYDGNNPNRVLREKQIDPAELIDLPKDGLLGAGAVEKVLEGLLR